MLDRLSHELRAPLQTLLGHVDLLRAGAFGPLTEEQREAFESVHRSAHKILGIANDVLAVAARKVTLTTVSLARLLTREADDLRDAAEAKGLSLSVECPKELEVTTDAAKLGRVVANLASNAVKYTKSGAVVLRGGPGFVEVTDTGAGIPRGRQQAVFDEFVRLNSGQEGSGLGLAIVRELTELMGATVKLDSVPAKGTTVRVELA